VPQEAPPISRFPESGGHVAFSAGVAPGASGKRSYGKTREGAPYSAFLKVAAPWGRGDLSAAASGYSISGFAIASPESLCGNSHVPFREAPAPAVLANSSIQRFLAGPPETRISV
jgi:hypothetical protein